MNDLVLDLSCLVRLDHFVDILPSYQEVQIPSHRCDTMRHLLVAACRYNQNPGNLREDAMIIASYLAIGLAVGLMVWAQPREVLDPENSFIGSMVTGILWLPIMIFRNINQ